MLSNETLETLDKILEAHDHNYKVLIDDPNFDGKRELTDHDIFGGSIPHIYLYDEKYDIHDMTDCLLKIMERRRSWMRLIKIIMYAIFRVIIASVK